MSPRAGGQDSRRVFRPLAGLPGRRSSEDRRGRHSKAGDGTVLPAGVYYIGLDDRFDDDRRLVRIAGGRNSLPAVITAHRAW